MHRPMTAATFRASVKSTLMRSCGLALVAAAALGAAPQLARADWPTVNGVDNQRYSPLKQIDTKTVAKLGAAQVIDGIAPAIAARSAPVIDGGMMIISSARYLYAVDIASGKILWKADPGGSPSRGGLAVGGGMVFVGAVAGDPSLIAFDEKTGQQVWKAILAPASGETTGQASLPVLASKATIWPR